MMYVQFQDNARRTDLGRRLDVQDLPVIPRNGDKITKNTHTGIVTDVHMDYDYNRIVISVDLEE